MRGRSKRRSTPGGERGSAAVEFALVVPLLFTLVFGIIDFGLGLGAQVNLTNGTREGARVGAVDLNAAHIESAVRAATSTLNQTALTVVVTCTSAAGPACTGGVPGGKSGDRITVTATYVYSLPAPLLVVAGNSLTLTSVSAMRIE